MKIGIYSSLPGGGIGHYNLEWLRSLSLEANFELEYACLPEFAWDPNIACDHWPGLLSLSSKRKIARRARFLLGQWSNPRRAIMRMHDTGATIMHFTNFNHLSYPGWRRLLDRSGMGVVLTAHDVRRQVAMVNRRYEDSQLRRIYQRADAILVHADAQVADLVDFASVNPDVIHKVPHGPFGYGRPRSSREEVRHSYGYSEGGLVGLFFGLIRDEKNLEGLLDAMASKGCQTKLLVAGKRASGLHRSVSEYQSIVRKLGLGERVTFDNRFVPDNEVADLVCACDWVALPYRSSFSSQSGVLNLAVHYERPVLAGAAPVLAETVNSFGIGSVGESDDSEDLLEALSELEDKISQKDPSLFGFGHYRRKCTWRENARITAEVYRGLA